MSPKPTYANSRPDAKVIVELSPDDSVLVEQLLEEWEYLLTSEPLPKLSESEKTDENELLQDIIRIGRSFSSARFHSLDEYDEKHNTSELWGSSVLESGLAWRIDSVRLRRRLFVDQRRQNPYLEFA